MSGGQAKERWELAAEELVRQVHHLLDAHGDKIERALRRSLTTDEAKAYLSQLERQLQVLELELWYKGTRPDHRIGRFAASALKFMLGTMAGTVLTLGTTDTYQALVNGKAQAQTVIQCTVDDHPADADDGEEEEPDDRLARLEQAYEYADYDSRPYTGLELGDAQAEVGNNSEARELYSEVITADSGYLRSRAALGLGQLEADLGNVDAARAAYSIAFQSDDSLIVRDAALRLGDLEAGIGNLDSAAANYRIAAESEDGEAARLARLALAMIGELHPAAGDQPDGAQRLF